MASGGLSVQVRWGAGKFRFWLIGVRLGMVIGCLLGPPLGRELRGLGAFFRFEVYRQPDVHPFEALIWVNRRGLGILAGVLEGGGVRGYNGGFGYAIYYLGIDWLLWIIVVELGVFYADPLIDCSGFLFYWGLSL